MRSLIIAVMFLLGLCGNNSAGAVKCVTSRDDSGVGTLRQAILDANSGLCDSIEIQIKGVIILESPLPRFETDIRLIGPGPEELVIDANIQPKVFKIGPNSVSLITGLTISNAVEIVPIFETGGGGAGIENEGALTLVDCIVTDCLVGSTDGGAGAGILNWGEMRVKGCTVTKCGNLFDPVFYEVAGGGIANYGSMGIDDTEIFDCHGYFGGGILNAGVLSVTRSKVVTCVAGPQADGGAIMNLGDLNLETCEISGNFGFWAGGVASTTQLEGGGSSGKFSCRNSLFSHNRSIDLGGGVMASGESEFVGCTFSGNEAGVGGGMLSMGKTRFVNCTLSGNSSSTEGSAVVGWNLGLAAALEFDHCTIVSNYSRVSTLAAAIDCEAGLVLLAGNSIIAHNDGQVVKGTLISLGHNLFGDSSGIVGTRKAIQTDLLGLDPRLGPLQDNGGFTPTHALLEGSPAIDAGFANRVKEDQRGQPRKRNLPTAHNSGDGSDIGAFEYQPIYRGIRAGTGKDKPANPARKR